MCVNIIQPIGDDTEDCRIELEPWSGVLEPREEKSITVHFIANRTVGVHVMKRSTIMTLLLNLDVANPVLGLKYTGLQIRGGKGYFSIDFLEFSIKN